VQQKRASEEDLVARLGALDAQAPVRCGQNRIAQLIISSTVVSVILRAWGIMNLDTASP
jgi:hypothetical protein